MEPMGIENGLLPEGQITASSFKSPDTNPLKVRLNSETSWSASTTKDPQYLQIDFGDSRNISAVVTKGSGDKPEWVTAFQVAYSDNEDDWEFVKNNDEEPIEFPGNTDKDTPTINVLPETIEAQYIRIVPTDWTNWISLRCEILGCYHPYEPPVTAEIPNAVLDEVVTFLPTEPTYVAACPNPMEVESSLLNDATIDASSSTLEGGPSRIRIGGWVPRVDDLHPVLLVELPEVKWLTSIYIQGREDEENWVTSLRVIGSQDNKTWLPVFGPDGHEKNRPLPMTHICEEFQQASETVVSLNIIRKIARLFCYQGCDRKPRNPTTWLN
ncbi:lactadherin [Trichonephila clavipes]|nr:lactadherin [Trichonephila clavipes]